MIQVADLEIPPDRVFIYPCTVDMASSTVI